jgi:hypothetical protein
MEATRSSKTSLYIKPTRRRIPEDGILQSKCGQSLCLGRDTVQTGRYPPTSQRTVLLPYLSTCFSILSGYSTLNTEAVLSSETSVNYLNTSRQIPQTSILRSHLNKNHKYFCALPGVRVPQVEDLWLMTASQSWRHYTFSCHGNLTLPLICNPIQMSARHSTLMDWCCPISDIIRSTSMSANVQREQISWPQWETSKLPPIIIFSKKTETNLICSQVL